MGYRYNLTIKDIPAEDRPRERLIKLGPEALSNAELFAVILRIGTPYENVVNHAERILKYHDLKDLSRASTDRLKNISWVGDTKACHLYFTFNFVTVKLH